MIHTLKSALSMSDDRYRAMLWDNFAINSSLDLSGFQAAQLIKFLKNQALQAGVWLGKSKEKYNNLLPRSALMATPKQLRKIEAIWGDVSRAKTTKERAQSLEKFIYRIVGIGKMEWLQKNHVNKIIKALETMKGNKS